MLRSLTHYRKINVAVMLAAAVNTAVLAGALIVGDSVRGSLRDMTLDRLGDIEQALVAERFFPEDLADRFAATDWPAADGHTAAAILLPGSVVNAENGARASRVNVHGVDERFVDMFPSVEGLTLERQQGQIFASVVINESLQRQVGAAVGEEVLLSFRTQDEIPDDTLLGNKENRDAFGTLRATVTGVIADSGIGRFGLSASQAFPANAYLAVEALQNELELPASVNAMFVSAPAAAGGGAAEEPADPARGTPADALRDIVRLPDLGLSTEWHDDRLLIESDEFVLRPPALQALDAAARSTEAGVVRVISYLATSMNIGERAVPYSTVAALAGEATDVAGLRLRDGAPAPLPTGNEILLNEWAFDDLQAAVGDTLRMEYYVVGPYEELLVESHDFVVSGVVSLSGLGADSRLTPDYPGIEDTDDIAAWDPPFPVDLRAVRAEDEEYWDDYGATPKAFVSEEVATELFGTRHGVVTSVRLTPPAGVLQREFEAGFAVALLDRLSLPQFGMRFVDVRGDGLAASSGATDFSGLFIGFSFFLIVSAAMLVGLLFSLGIEARAGEVGLLLAVGYSEKRVRRRMLAEGGIVAAVGAGLGLLAGVGYAALMMLGLRTLWLPAVGTTMLSLHVRPTSLAVGWAISVAVVLASIWWTVRRLGRVPTTALLRGALGSARDATRGGRRWRIAIAALATLFALTMLAAAVATGTTMDPMVFGTIGFPLLVAGLVAFAEWCRGAHGRLGTPGGTAVVAMAARNSAWSPGRSILSVALVAFASFVIVTVAANHRDPTREGQSRSSGTGGFALFATAEIPLHDDLNDREARFDLGFDEEDEALLADARILPLRAVPGDDASCLNLYRPQNPRLVGASPALIERGGFRFAATLPPDESAASAGSYDPANPWTLLYQDFGPGVVPVIGDLNSVQWILHLGLGDEIVVTDELGEPLSLRVVGTFAESIFRSELLMSDENLLAHFPSRSGYSTFLVDLDADAAGATTVGGAAGGGGNVAGEGAMSHDERIDSVSAALERILGPYGFDAERTDEKLAAYLVVQNTYLSTFQLLGGLGLLLGTVGLGVVLVRNVIERRAELATLRAFGFARSSLSRMVLAENAFLLLLGVSIGTLASLIAVAPRFVGDGFTLPWASLGIILLAVLAAGMLSSIAAVAGALRVPLLPVLKGDR